MVTFDFFILQGMFPDANKEEPKFDENSLSIEVFVGNGTKSSHFQQFFDSHENKRRQFLTDSLKNIEKSVVSLVTQEPEVTRD